jgi:exonuclease III
VFEEDQFGKMAQDFIVRNGRQLSLLCFNINGLPKKRDEFDIFQETLKFKFDILGFTETHLNEVSEKLATLEDYNWAANSRKIKRGGGVAVYLGPLLAYKRRTDIDVFEEGVFESVFVEVNMGVWSYIVGVIYRPPDSDTARFLFHLGSVLSKIKDKRSYLMGDFNLDLIKNEHHAATVEFLNDLNSSGFHPLISLPTRITPTSATLIDV